MLSTPGCPRNPQPILIHTTLKADPLFHSSQVVKNDKSNNPLFMSLDLVQHLMTKVNTKLCTVSQTYIYSQHSLLTKKFKEVLLEVNQEKDVSCVDSIREISTAPQGSESLYTGLIIM